jgi:predicted hydrocarbon binding protein
MTKLRSVSVPDAFAEAFQDAERHVAAWFDTLELDPAKGEINVGGERYILVRAASMSVHFTEFIRSMYPGLEEKASISIVNQLLFDVARAIGENDARNFHAKMKVTDPVERLSTGPVHFAYSGWAFVAIHPDSRPAPDDSYYLLYDHPQSFECDAWLAAGGKTEHCVCHMNAGYSSGWCSESFGLQLTAREITCRARGDERCRFIMAVPSRIEEFIDRYLRENGGDADGS